MTSNVCSSFLLTNIACLTLLFYSLPSAEFNVVTSEWWGRVPRCTSQEWSDE